MNIIFLTDVADLFEPSCCIEFLLHWKSGDNLESIIERFDPSNHKKFLVILGLMICTVVFYLKKKYASLT